MRDNIRDLESATDKVHRREEHAVKEEADSGKPSMGRI